MKIQISGFSWDLSGPAFHVAAIGWYFGSRLHSPVSLVPTNACCPVLSWFCSSTGCWSVEPLPKTFVLFHDSPLLKMFIPASQSSFPHFPSSAITWILLLILQEQMKVLLLWDLALSCKTSALHEGWRTDLQTVTSEGMRSNISVLAWLKCSKDIQFE